MQNNQIHPNDDMFTGNLTHYLSVGKQFADLIVATAKLKSGTKAKVLELPCGYGRVTRHLVAALSERQITCADIMKPAVSFCKEQYGVDVILVEEPAEQFQNVPNEAYDVAAMGSLITHFAEPLATSVIKNFVKKVKRGGHVVLTLHGERAYRLMMNDSWFGIPKDEREVLRRSYESGQFGFVPYWSDHAFEKKTVDYVGSSYGVSLTPKLWATDLLKELGCNILEYRSGGWDDHQDIVIAEVQ
ncbi:class I SAM-dependent methyltransferase [Agrobacterium sp. SHOUNA12C]|nr:class I SAM-dependent methyltransferase [Agrobacterium sp. BETTINA12B]MCJ9757008.1 class I SAM-dependent methyltransferase [Agrobacterium sp. SHOUNA12C]